MTEEEAWINCVHRHIEIKPIFTVNSVIGINGNATVYLVVLVVLVAVMFVIGALLVYLSHGV